MTVAAPAPSHVGFEVVGPGRVVLGLSDLVGGRVHDLTDEAMERAFVARLAAACSAARAEMHARSAPARAIIG